MLEPLDGRLFGDDQPCFGCAPAHPHGFRLRFERREEGGVRTRFLPGDDHQGPPGVMHGGLVMALADEVGAWAVIAEAEKFGFTSHAECRLLRPVRIGREVIGVGRVTVPGRRVVTTEVELWQEDEMVCRAKLKFVLLDETSAERVLGMPVPDRWKRFGR